MRVRLDGSPVGNRVALVSDMLRSDLPSDPILLDDDDGALDALIYFATMGRGHWRRRWYANGTRP